MKKNGVAVARGSRLKLRAAKYYPLKCAAATVRITEQARSRLEQDRTATADSGMRRRVRSTAGSHFPSFRRAARARYLLRSAKRGFLSKVNCLKYDSSAAKGAKIGPFPRYDERSTSPSRPSSNSRRNPETYRALRRSFILPQWPLYSSGATFSMGLPSRASFPVTSHF
jgi:hypothetical protein